MNKRLIKIITTLMTIALISGFLMPTASYAVNEQFDDPSDNYTSQNEALTDLMNEPGPDAPSITGTSYILYDSLSGVTVMGRNPDEKLEPASTTKIMTILLALENLSPDEMVTITPDMHMELPADYVTVGLIDGEEVSVRDLMYAAMLTSANDATLALAIYMGGTQLSFCMTMNERARELGCTNTNFTNAYGLSDPNHVTTAADLALILEEALTHPEFREMATTISYTMSPTNLYDAQRVINNANRFISTQEYAYDYYIGGKTGYTESAGYTLVAAAEKNDRILIGVILGATDANQRFRDMINLFEYGFTHFTTIPVDYTEFTAIVNSTIEQVNGALVNTDLQVTEYDYLKTLSPYLTTTSERVASGCTNMVELSGQSIDSSNHDQTLELPLCKVFNDGKTYIVGALTLRITTRDRVVEIKPEKQSSWSRIKFICRTVFVISLLLMILVIAFLIFRRSYRRKMREESRRRSRML